MKSFSWIYNLNLVELKNFYLTQKNISWFKQNFDLIYNILSTKRFCLKQLRNFFKLKNSFIDHMYNVQRNVQISLI